VTSFRLVREANKLESDDKTTEAGLFIIGCILERFDSALRKLQHVAELLCNL
jgi:hypothetical protein